MARKPLLNLPQGSYDPEKLLGSELYQGGGGAILSQMARRGDLGSYAITQQQIIDQTRAQTRPAPPFGYAPGPTPQAGGPVIPPSMTDPITGGFKVPDGIRAQMRRAGIDPGFIEKTVTRNMLEQSGGDYQQRLLLGSQAGTSPDKLQAAKEELFSKTARAIAADPSQKDRILTSTFTGPNAGQLLAEYDAKTAKDAHGGFLDKLGDLGKGTLTSFGQMMSGLSGPGDVVRTAIATLTGARKENGQAYTAGDIGAEIKQLPTDIFNVLSLGTAGLTDKRFRSVSAAPSTQRIAETMRTRGVGDEIASLLHPALGLTRAAQQIDHPAARVVESLFGFGGDVATDPTTYLTLGAGGLGSSATRIAGEIAERGTILTKLGMGDLIPRFIRADQNTWETLLQDLGGELGPKVAAARDVGKAVRTSAESAHGAQGWAGYKNVLAAQGLDADTIVPRQAFGTGRQAKLAARETSIRGGVGLRGGIGFGPLQVRGAVNLKTGGRPRTMGTWFTREGNRFHQLPSKTLDMVSGVFHYGAETDRKWVHSNRGLFNATMEQGVLGQGVKSQFDDLGNEIDGAGDRLGKWLGKDPERHPIWLADIIEKQERSDYWGMVDDNVKAQAERLWRATDTGRTVAAHENTDIPMLREALNDKATRLRYFPRKVTEGIQRSMGLPVVPVEPGMAKARGLRAGSRITGPDGTSKMLGEGSFAEVQEVTADILGVAIYDMDPIKVYKAYNNLLGQAAALNRTYRGLTEAGLLIPNVQSLVPGAQFVAGADNVRAIWSTPLDKAEAAAADARLMAGTRAQDLAQVTRQEAVAAAEEVQLKSELASYASRQADADSKISALRKDRHTQRRMLKLADDDYRTSLAEAKRSFAANKRELTRSAQTDLAGVKGGKQLWSRRMRELRDAHLATVKELGNGHKAQVEVLTVTPTQLRASLEADLRRAGDEVRNGTKSYTQVRSELIATRHRLAQVEGGELAKGRQMKALLRSAKGTAEKVRGGVVKRQQAAAARVASLTDDIEATEGAVQRAAKASDSRAETAARTRLADLQGQRAVHLRDAEQSSAEAAELADLVDAGEAGMRFAELREGEVLMHEAGASIDGQFYRMASTLQDRLSTLLRAHAADLVASNNAMIADAPKLKFLNRAMREFSQIDTSVAAIPQLPPGGALADYAQEFMARVEGRGAEIVGAWEAAVGPERALSEAVAEHTRQHSAMLAREIDLSRQLDAARRMAPKEKALATHQAQGDELNMLTAELHKHDRELEWWQANRDELRKTQTLKSIALAELTKGNEGLQRKVAAMQRLADTDQEAASMAAAEVLAVPGIFKLMSPEVEHVTAVLGKLPFMEHSGAAMPKEAAAIVQRLLDPAKGQDGLMAALTYVNTKWKRSVLAVPGSVFRRWIGNLYNAAVLAGVSPSSFRKSFDAMGRAKDAKHLDQIADPELRRYMELAMEYNIFEGQLFSLATDTHRYAETPGFHPIRKYGETLQIAAMRGEDIARFAQFIDGLDQGMGPHAARMWTGKFHFFNSELTEKERTYAKPLYPFYAYLRNNFALQFSTLFHQPGKISLYGHMMRDFSAQPEGSTEPGFVTQAGGFPITGDRWLQNTLLDTSPLGLPQTILGLSAGSGFELANLFQGEGLSSMGPTVQAGRALLTGTSGITGQPMYPQEMAPSLKPLTSALQALGVVDDQGKWKPRQLAAFQAMFPQLNRVARGASGGLTPAQAEQQPNWWASQLIGPGVQTQTPRRAEAAYGERGRELDEILASLKAQGAAVPKTSDLTKEERTKRALEALGIGP